MSILSKEIIEGWGIGNLSPAEQDDAVERLGRILYQAILVKSLDILSDSEEDELDALLNINTTTVDDVLGFLHSKIPTFNKLLSDERDNLKKSLVVKS